MHNSFILQQYVYYTMISNMFRAARCSSSGGQIVSPQPVVSSPSVNSRTVCRLRADCRFVDSCRAEAYAPARQLSTNLQSALNLHTVRLFTEGDDTRGCCDTIRPPEDEQRAARNMLRIIV